MDVRVGLWRKLSAEELMLLNCGVGEDSWESLGLHGDPTSPFSRRSVLGFLWKDWCWSWNSNTLATSCEELTHLARLWCWEGLRARGKGDDRGWDGWMASPTRWTWVWVNSGSWWWTGRRGVLQFMGSQRVGHDWATELNWIEYLLWTSLGGFPAGSDGKESACSAGDLGSILGSRRSPGERNGYPLQYSCLENPMEELGRLQSMGSHAESQTWLRLSLHLTSGTVYSFFVCLFVLVFFVFLFLFFFDSCSVYSFNFFDIQNNPKKAVNCYNDEFH